MIQQQLNEYITKEELELLGNPLPKAQDDIDWEGDDFTFEFELGIAPEFEVEVKGKKAITHYEIKTDDDTLNRQIDRIREQYGKLIAKDSIADGDQITGVFRNDDEEINSDATFKTDKLKGKTNLKKFIGSKVGDTLD